VFAVVANDVISILAKATAGTKNHVFAVEARIAVGAYGDGPAASKFRQRHLFHRSALEASDETGVMDDPPVTHVKAVVEVAAARRDEVCSQRRLFAVLQHPRIREPSSRKLHHGYILHDAYRRGSP
jgi:hypothetical protein